MIINSDGGSTDGTAEAVLSARLEDAHLLLVSTPLSAVHRLSFPYHGIPGKGSAFRLIFQMAARLQAKACAVVDSDLRSITPEWFDLLLRPILMADFDFVAPYYHRHKYDGTITNSIVYPLTRSLYGLRVRQPIGGEFGISRRLVARYLERDDWETDVARYGIDIWMTTIAIAEGYRVCQSFLGAKLHDAKDPGADLSAMLHQVVGSVFRLDAGVPGCLDEVLRKPAGRPVRFPFRCGAGSHRSQPGADAGSLFTGAARTSARCGHWPWPPTPTRRSGHSAATPSARLPRSTWMTTFGPELCWISPAHTGDTRSPEVTY